jgi:hypothetical protein
MSFGAFRSNRPLRLDAGEVTGALGDSLTVLPVVVALGALTPLSLSKILLWFGVFQVVWGVTYGLPVSVEPMKALAGLAIAGTISAGELVAAGLVAGVVLVAASRLHALSRLRRLVGQTAIRAVQFAVALLLAEAGVTLALADPTLAAGAAAVAGVVLAAGRGRFAALAVLGVGVGAALAAAGGVTPALPTPSLLPVAPVFSVGAAEATLAQLAMTVGNAAVATALLCADLFDADVSPDRLAGSMGSMCLVSVPFGGLPMCHGSGGLAGKHAFGARTGGANLVLGVLYLGAACLAGVVAAFPTAVLGVLLLAVAVHLGRTALSADRRLVVVGAGVLGLLVNVGAALVVAAAVTRTADRLTERG